MKTITIIAGCHGVGKTSFLGALSGIDPHLGEIIDEDKILLECGSNTLLRDRTVCEKIRDCTKRGINLAFKTALPLPMNRMKKELEYAIQQGFMISLNYIAIDSREDCIERVRNRVKKGGRFVSEDEIIASYVHRWDSLAAIIPYCISEISLYDNNNGFEKVGECKQGATILTSSFAPEWFTELTRYIQ